MHIHTLANTPMTSSRLHKPADYVGFTIGVGIYNLMSVIICLILTENEAVSMSLRALNTWATFSGLMALTPLAHLNIKCSSWSLQASRGFGALLATTWWTGLLSCHLVCYLTPYFSVKCLGCKVHAEETPWGPQSALYSLVY